MANGGSEIFLDTYHIRGGYYLNGEVALSGAKNSVLPIFAASVVTGAQSKIVNCPEISDAENMRDILKMLGCSVHKDGGTVVIDSAQISAHTIGEKLMSTMRSSVFLAGSLLVRCGIAEIGKPGGCKIGARPIDIHIDMLKALGAEAEENEGRVVLKARKLKGAQLTLPFPSVGATENTIIAASCADGETVLSNAAREPEIVDLQDFLNRCGAKIKGAGTHTVTIEGVKELHAAEYEIIPDRIEAGTFMCMAAATKGEIHIKNARPAHLETVSEALEALGCEIRTTQNGMWIKQAKPLRGTVEITTAPFPGFPTDLQPQFTAAVCAAGLTGVVREKIFENRFGYAKELNKMGAAIEICGKNAIITRGHLLKGNRVVAEDLRGGAALVTAALAAEGDSIVCGTEYIKRGYFSLDKKLRLLGAEIKEHNG